MATYADTMHNPRLKTMVVPREHGAWGMLLIPLLTGIVVAAPVGINPWTVALFLLASLALFWLRTPVEAWTGTSPIKAQSAQEIIIVRNTSIVLSAIALLSVVALCVAGYWSGLLLIGVFAAISFALQVVVKRAGRRGRMPAQLIGAIGLTSTAASAYYVATGRLDRIALALWLANWLFAGNQVHFVQLRIHAGRAITLREKLRLGRGFLVGQSVLLGCILALGYAGILPWLAVLAFAPALLRGTLWLVRAPRPLHVHRLGFSELFQAILFGVLLCAAYLR